MRAGIAAADHGPAIEPQVATHSPTGVIIVLRSGPQHGAQVVGNHDIEQTPEARLATFSGNIAHRTTFEALVDLRKGVTDHVVAPIGQTAEHASFWSLTELQHPQPGVGVAQSLNAFWHRTIHDRVPPRNQPQTTKVEKTHIHWYLDWHGECHHSPTSCRCFHSCFELASNPFGYSSVNSQYVPIQRTPSRRAHGRQHVDFGVRKLIQTARHNPFKARAIVTAGLCGECHQLVNRCPSTGHGFAVAVGMTRRCGE